MPPTEDASALLAALSGAADANSPLQPQPLPQSARVFEGDAPVDANALSLGDNGTVSDAVLTQALASDGDGDGSGGFIVDGGVVPSE